jgi:hypothetical protein
MSQKDHILVDIGGISALTSMVGVSLMELKAYLEAVG